MITGIVGFTFFFVLSLVILLLGLQALLAGEVEMKWGKVLRDRQPIVFWWAILAWLCVALFFMFLGIQLLLSV